jgi:hypothetical protein
MKRVRKREMARRMDRRRKTNEAVARRRDNSSTAVPVRDTVPFSY